MIEIPFASARTAFISASLLLSGQLTALTMLPGASYAAAKRPPACEAIAARLARKTGAAFDVQRDSKRLVFSMSMPHADIEIRCPLDHKRRLAIVLRSDQEYPPRSFYDLLAEAGAGISSRSARHLRLRAHRCHRAARRSPDGRASKRFHSFAVECRRSAARSVFILRSSASPRRGLELF